MSRFFSRLERHQIGGEGVTTEKPPNAAALLAWLKGQNESVTRPRFRYAIEPLDATDALRILHIVPVPDRFEIVHVLQPIKIEVEHGRLRLVNVEQSVGGAECFGLGVEAGDQSLHQRGLAGAEVSDEAQEVPGRKDPCQLPAQRDGVFGIGQSLLQLFKARIYPNSPSTRSWISGENSSRYGKDRRGSW